MKPALLVLTSTYPRWRNDVEPGFVHELSRRLTNEYEVHVLAPHFAGALTEEVMDGVSIHRFRYCFAAAERLAYEGGMLTNARRHPWLLLLLPVFLLAQFVVALRLIRQHQVALVHAHWVIPQGVVAWLIKLLKPGIPLVITSHGGDVYGLRGAVLGWIKKRVYSAADTVAVVSNAMASDLQAQLQLLDLRVAPMGVDLKARFVLRQALEGRSGLVFVGRLVEKKGVGVLLDAMAKLLQQFPDTHLKIIGHGPDRKSLERQAAALSISHAVTFTGAVPNGDIPELLNEAAIAVVPSVIAASGDQEGLGLVTVEAMGCGCAVVASDLPAIRDVVAHGHNGLLFPMGNSGALAECLRQLMEDDALRQQLALSGRDSALLKFDWSTAAGTYLELYCELLGS